MPTQLFFQVAHLLNFKTSKYEISSCIQIFLVKTLKIRTTMNAWLNRMENAH